MHQVELDKIVLPNECVLHLVVLFIHRFLPFLCNFDALLEAFLDLLEVELKHVDRCESLVEEQVEVCIEANYTLNFFYRRLELLN
jgi:hypothetical protein